MSGLGLSKYAPEFMLVFYFWLKFSWHYLRAKSVDSADCPVSGGKKAKVFRYGKDPYATGEVLKLDEISKGHDKYCCVECKHLYALWLRKSANKVGELYSNIYAGGGEVYTENDRKDIQKEMMRIAHKYCSGNVEGAFAGLDFGCGPNFRAAYELRDEGIEAYCSDILPKLPYDGKVFFKFDEHSAEIFKNRFSAISSVDVLEHLNWPVNDFLVFNRMLKPKGFMVHFTPMINHFPVFGSHADHVFHTNFFSSKSLAIICEKTSFRLVNKVVKPRGYWYYIFQKLGEACG
ncbi:MAG: class I SAM-dependent methyltransferase [Candidatus Marinimicrobia bacterium]|nr:class I SAM-dependent methyltransferase [Candidatus Neomarinimicrobiota bacterium]